jgi:NarL family two-component system response regulator LiaR
MGMAMIRLFLVDDHHVVRQGMRTFLESFSDLQVVGEAANAEEALARLEQEKADVVVMDLLLPGGMDGIAATREIRRRFPGLRVVVLTAYTDEARAAAAWREGAAGYVRKDSQPEFLLDVIRAAAAGARRFDPAAGLDADAALAGPKDEALTAREMDVLRLLAGGKTNREIAVSLSVGEETVKSHVASILAKLGLASRGQAVAFALRHGWVRPEEV